MSVTSFLAPTNRAVTYAPAPVVAGTASTPAGAFPVARVTFIFAQRPSEGIVKCHPVIHFRMHYWVKVGDEARAELTWSSQHPPARVDR